jgi:hypothetical protein
MVGGSLHMHNRPTDEGNAQGQDEPWPAKSAIEGIFHVARREMIGSIRQPAQRPTTASKT